MTDQEKIVQYKKSVLRDCLEGLDKIDYIEPDIRYDLGPVELKISDNRLERPAKRGRVWKKVIFLTPHGGVAQIYYLGHTEWSDQGKLRRGVAKGLASHVMNFKYKLGKLYGL